MATFNIRGSIAGSPLDGQTFGGHFSIELDESGAWGVPMPFLDLEFHFNGHTRAGTGHRLAGDQRMGRGGVRAAPPPRVPPQRRRSWSPLRRSPSW